MGYFQLWVDTTLKAANEMAQDLSSEDALNKKLQQVAKEAFAIWYKNGEVLLISLLSYLSYRFLIFVSAERSPRARKNAPL